MSYTWMNYKKKFCMSYPVVGVAMTSTFLKASM